MIFAHVSNESLTRMGLALVFPDDRPCGRWRRRRCGGEIERQPEIPARRPILVGKFAIGFQVQISLQVSDRKNVANLRTNADHPRLEAADSIAGAAVAADLLVEVTHETDLPLLGQELRHAPVEVHVDATLILSSRVYEV